MTADIALPIRPSVEAQRPPSRAAGPERDAGAPPPPPAPVTPNPRLRLDAPLGMVVIEFRDSVGDVANTIPSPRQMAAYRAAAVFDAPMPAGIPARAPATVAMPDAPAMPVVPAMPEAPPPPAPEAAPAQQSV